MDLVQVVSYLDKARGDVGLFMTVPTALQMVAQSM